MKFKKGWGMDNEQVQQLLDIQVLDIVQHHVKVLDEVTKRLKILEGLVAQMVKESGYDTREEKKDE